MDVYRLDLNNSSRYAGYARDSICGYGGACTFRVSDEKVKEFMDAVENGTIREYLFPASSTRPKGN